MPDGDNEILSFRQCFPELDGDLDNEEIARGFELCTDMGIVAPRERLYAAAHLALHRESDLPATTRSVDIGGLRRDFITMAERGSNDAFWGSSSYGRLYLIAARSKRGAAVISAA